MGKQGADAAKEFDLSAYFKLPQREAARKAKAHLRQFHSETIETLKRSRNDVVVSVLGAALVDEQLTEAIKSKFVENDTISDAVFHHKDGLPLAGKIELGYALGLYSEFYVEDMRLLSQVRNKMAHQLAFKVTKNGEKDRLSFKHPMIVKACNQLFFGKSLIRKTPANKGARARFVTAAVRIAEELGMIRLGLVPPSTKLRQRTRI